MSVPQVLSLRLIRCPERESSNFLLLVLWEPSGEGAGPKRLGWWVSAFITETVPSSSCFHCNIHTLVCAPCPASRSFLPRIILQSCWFVWKFYGGDVGFSILLFQTYLQPCTQRCLVPPSLEYAQVLSLNQVASQAFLTVGSRCSFLELVVSYYLDICFPDCKILFCLFPMFHLSQGVYTFLKNFVSVNISGNSEGRRCSIHIFNCYL